jgi:hypothetical protein
MGKEWGERRGDKRTKEIKEKAEGRRQKKSLSAEIQRSFSRIITYVMLQFTTLLYQIRQSQVC